MKIIDSEKILGLKIISPDTNYDYRGEYIETFNDKIYQFNDSNGNSVKFVRDDISVSRKNTLRGLHGDNQTWKLIQCLWGEIYIAIADLRQDSKTYMQYETFSVNDKNRIQILIPAGCVNGHLCLSEKCIFSYKQSAHYEGQEKEISIRWNDPKLQIPWPINEPILSVRDKNAKTL